MGRRGTRRPARAGGNSSRPVLRDNRDPAVHACEVTATKTATDAIGFLGAALDEVKNLLGVTWIENLADPDTGEIGTLRIVTDNGPCFKSAKFTAWAASKRHIAHIRTRNRAPWTNGAIERFFGAIKHEHLYRRDIPDGLELAAQARAHRTVYNTIRPHQATAMARPPDRYRQTPTTQPPHHEYAKAPNP